MNRIKKILLLAGLAAVLSSPQNTRNLEARTLNVPRDYHSIQMAVDAAADSDTVFVAQGTYIGHISIKNKSLSLLSSDGPDSTYISTDQHSGSVIAVLNSKNYKIDGFTITSHKCNGISTLNSSGLISQNSITNTVTAISVENGDYTDIWNNRIERNTQGINSSADSTLIGENNIGYNGSSLSDYVIKTSKNAFIKDNVLIYNKSGISASGGYTEILNNNFDNNFRSITIDQGFDKLLAMYNLFLNDKDCAINLESISDTSSVLVKCNGFNGNSKNSNFLLPEENFYTKPKFSSYGRYYRPLEIDSFYSNHNPCGGYVGAFHP